MGRDFQEGEIFAIDKPYGMTSFHALSRIRYLLSRALGVKRLKVGHAGTLDPLASGVLLIATGRKTKMIETLQRGDKEYIAEVRLGATTPSFDREHTVDFTYPWRHITREGIEAALERFQGEIMQVPPDFSACKIGGIRAYRLKRQQQEVKLLPKSVCIKELELLQADFLAPEACLKSADFSEDDGFSKEGGFSQERGINHLVLRVVCSKGTYIRSLARDLGEVLSSGAYLMNLRRTRVGEYRVEDALKMECAEAWVQRAVAS